MFKQIYSRLAGAASALGVVLGLGATYSYAAFDATVGAAVDSAMTDWSSQALEKVADLLPIAAGIMITVAVLFAVIKYFRALVKM